MKTLLLALPLTLLAACAGTSSQSPAANVDDLAPAILASRAAATPQDIARLQARHWRLQRATTADGRRIDALFVRPDRPLTLDFSQGHVSVSNSCNRLGGSFELGQARLTIGPLAATKMACSDPALMALDDEAGSRLHGQLEARFPGDDELALRTADGDVLVFQGEPTAEARHGGPGEQVFLEVAAQTRACPHPLIKDKQCLQVREVRFDENGLKQGEPGAYENFYSDIEGYVHEPGTRNVLRVKRFKLAHPPADGSSLAYVLDMVVESSTGP